MNWNRVLVNATSGIDIRLNIESVDLLVCSKHYTAERDRFGMHYIKTTTADGIVERIRSRLLYYEYW